MQRDRAYQEELRSYIIDNLDKAIENGYIKIYYQPVLRTLTGEICGMEALARWEDPEHGLLAPIDFIPTLEKAKLIYKLDCCVIKTICREYAALMESGEETFSVSFNVSRTDFAMCDMHEIIDEAIKTNHLPRDAFRVEITESMLESNEKRMRDVIDRFWDHGLRVWMDDFGSGYSSLNVLKDYHFDTLKIDMLFLRDFDLRSREIIKSIVDMSKRIGVHTLAEGVETMEQLDFLRSIGCEKAQGYLIGKPMPYDECVSHLQETGRRFEARGKKQYYHDIGTVNLLSPTPMQLETREEDYLLEKGQMPVSIVEMSGKKIHYLFANENYIRTIKSVGMDSLKAIEDDYNMGVSAFGKRFMAMLRKAKQTGEIVTVNFVRNGKHCFAQVKKVAEHKGGTAYLCMLQNLSVNENVEKDDSLSNYINDLFSIYDEVEVIDLNTGYSHNIYMSTQNLDEYNKRPAADELRDFARRQVYPEDRERFVEFMDISTMEERLDNSTASFISSPFRILGTDGNYTWKILILFYAGDRKNRRILSCLRMVDDSNVRTYNEAVYGKASGKNETGKAHGGLTPEVLWNNLVQNSAFNFFWKDKDRRFLGVSRAFLDYYGLESDAELIGKNDEEVGWHVDPTPYKNDEEIVLETGERVKDVPGKCICNGEIRDIEATKFPIYDDGEIVGLFGRFIDVSEKRDMPVGSLLTTTDTLTGMLNFLGIIDCALHYQESYVTQGIDFAMVFLDIEKFHNYNESYGMEWGNALLNKVGQVLRFTVGITGIAGRYSADHFLVIAQCREEGDILRLIERIEDRVSKIENIEGVPCTVYFKTGYARYSETRSIQALYTLAEKRAIG